MKLIFKDFDINFENIVFSKIKKNIIMDGNFNKILYSDTFVTINGLYILTPLILNYFSSCSEKSGFEFNFSTNSYGRSPENSFSSERSVDEKMKNDFFGMQCRKNATYLHFCSYTPHNLFIIKKISEIENRILNYYKSYYEIKNKIVLNISNLLNTGRIKVYNFPSQATENGSSPSLRSSESLNSNFQENDQRSYPENSFPSTLRSDAFLTTYGPSNIQQISHFSDWNVEKFIFSSVRSVDEKEISGERPKEFVGNLKIILKISGVWETKTEIGLSYKFIEIYENSRE